MTSNPPPIPPGPGGLYPIPYPIPSPGTEPGTEPGPANPEEEAIRRRDEERRRRLDLVDVLTEEHHAIEELVASLPGMPDPPQRRLDAAEVLIAQLSRHAAVERQHLYPAVRDRVTGGDRLADEAVDHDREIEQTTQRLSEVEVTDPLFDRLLAELTTQLERHTQHQENNLFARLRAACDRQRLRELAHHARSARELAPTRPHPRAPDRPPWSAAARPVLGAADKIRDEMSGRPTELRDLATGRGTYPRGDRAV